jgi:hypothetical protein
VEVADLSTGASDDLEFSDQVASFAVGYGKLLVATISQCKVFTIGNSFGAAASSATVDVNDLLLGISLAPRCFCLLLASAGPQVLDPGTHFCKICTMQNGPAST